MVTNYNFKDIQKDSVKWKLQMLKRNVESLLKTEKDKVTKDYLDFMKKLIEEIEEQFEYYTTHKFKYEDRLEEIKKLED